MHLIHTEAEQSAKPNAPRFIRRREVQKLTGLGASSIYQLQRMGNFPQSVQISERRVAWVESEVVEWISQRIADRPAANDEATPEQGAR